jgi:hypothetical protein
VNNLISKFSVLFFVSLIALSTSAFSQNNRVVGSSQALPMKDFPVQCMSLCEQQARAYDAIKDAVKRTSHSFYGCGSYPATFGSPGEPMRSLVDKIRTGQLNAAANIEFDKEYIQNVKAGKFSSVYTPDEYAYIVASKELDICVLSNLIGVTYTGNLKDNNPTHTNPRLNNTQNPSSGGLGNQTSNSSQQQQLQAAVIQSQTRAREAQQRGDADAQRRGRRVHDPAAEAHDCLSVDPSGLFGAMVNNCSYKVNYTVCAFKPRDEKALDSGWLTSLNCEKHQFGTDSVGSNNRQTQHTKGTERLHWFACKDPAWPLETSFEGGEIVGRCRPLMGN